ncbi:oxidoreductase of aldo/keto reductase family subgroup 1 [Lactococcus lactis subsp. lactis]|uniref:Aldo/keto reductase n=2 Tax=Lactococcus lactis TaxID=1358 RepID=A0A2A5SJL9_LACLH|nr:aldo/keto reductase [Lactococcus lactis]KAA8705005.1 aldo/keto reductase [Lactococcus lactis subsp. hordniae]KSU06152.1 oxidoreductase of aldo/keto reductase family subgroup 1 [Lactococcus lactis subsp. lactis]MCT3134231.1 aldo/keto reductase [Lactococcus lactis]PCS13635.1 oxidoreductase [Lactococcus lactis subsp. hordniae]
MKLNNQIEIPELGLGVFQIPNEETADVVKNAIVNGYRLIDTAKIYENEEGTGHGIKEGLAMTGLSREDLFITSKLWGDNHSYEETIQNFEESLKKLYLDYLDLYLIHWPGTHYAYKEAWKGMEDLYKAGKIKAIGVSNFQKSHLEELRNFLELHDIMVQAWSPLMQGQLLDNEVLKKIADKHGKSVAQIILRWDIQQDILVNVKSIKSERMIANRQIFDFSLDSEDMKAINSLNEELRVGPDPEHFNF